MSGIYYLLILCWDTTLWGKSILTLYNTSAFITLWVYEDVWLWVLSKPAGCVWPNVVALPVFQGSYQFTACLLAISSGW